MKILQLYLSNSVNINKEFLIKCISSKACIRFKIIIFLKFAFSCQNYKHLYKKGQLKLPKKHLNYQKKKKKIKIVLLLILMLTVYNLIKFYLIIIINLVPDIAKQELG